MYSYIKDNNNGSKPAKRTKKNVIKQNLTHKDYKNTLFNKNQMQHTIKLIRSELHQILSYELSKILLSCFNDKRCIHDNGITSYAYGHYKNKFILYYAIINQIIKCN